MSLKCNRLAKRLHTVPFLYLTFISTDWIFWRFGSCENPIKQYVSVVEDYRPMLPVCPERGRSTTTFSIFVSSMLGKVHFVRSTSFLPVAPFSLCCLDFSFVVLAFHHAVCFPFSGEFLVFLFLRHDWLIILKYNGRILLLTP